MKKFIVFLAFLAVFACKARQDSASDVKWGHLAQMDPDVELIYLPPNSSIAVCGKFATLARRLIKDWAHTIGRDQYLQITGCEGSSSATKIMTIYDWATDEAKKRCAISFPQGGAGGFRDRNDIVLCMDYSDAQLEQALRHELGHSCGLCDQYTSTLAGSDNCDSKHSGPKDPNDAMGAWTSTIITDDDGMGMKAMAARTDIPANAEWLKILGEPKRSWHCGMATSRTQACLLDDKTVASVVVDGTPYSFIVTSRASAWAGATDYTGTKDLTGVPGLGPNAVVTLAVQPDMTAALYYMNSGDTAYTPWSKGTFKLDTLAQ